MKKRIIEWFNKNGIYVIAALFITLIFVGGISDCSTKRSVRLVEQSQYEDWRQSYEDSLNKAYIIKQNEAIRRLRTQDSIDIEGYKKSAERKQTVINNLQKKITVLEKISIDAVNNYKASNNQTEECDTAIAKLIDYSDELSNQNDTLKSLVEDLGNEAETYSRQLYLCDKENANLLRLSFINKEAIERERLANEQLRKQIKKDNSWWKRNDKWFYLGIGIVGTGLVLK